MLGFDYCMISGLFVGFLCSLFYVILQLDRFLHPQVERVQLIPAVLCTSAKLSCGFFEGCKEELKDPFGHLHITYSANFPRDCTWTIGNSGISKPVATVSIEEVQFGYCR